MALITVVDFAAPADVLLLPQPAAATASADTVPAHARIRGALGNPEVRDLSALSTMAENID
jgi:hypothetical protein